MIGKNIFTSKLKNKFRPCNGFISEYVKLKSKWGKIYDISYQHFSQCCSGGGVPSTIWSALHWAAKVSQGLQSPHCWSLSSQHDNDQMISSLMMSAGTSQAVINKQSHGGYTPLHVAAINKSQRAFSTLMMDFKADRKIRDYSGKTATSYLRNVINSDLELKRKGLK